VPEATEVTLGPDFGLLQFPKDKPTLHVDPAGQKPNTINPDLVQ